MRMSLGVRSQKRRTNVMPQNALLVTSKGRIVVPFYLMM